MQSRNPCILNCCLSGSRKNIRRATRKRHSSEEKDRIVLDGLRGESSYFLRFPDAREFDLTWRTQEVRHVGSDTIAPRFWCVPAAWFGEEDERRPSGPSASGARRNL